MEHLIKRYRNRKLYDVEKKKYINLKDVFHLIRSGETVRIIDNQSGKDITQSILVQIQDHVEEKTETESPPHMDEDREIEDFVAWLKQGNEIFKSTLKNALQKAQKITQEFSQRSNIKKPPFPPDIISQLKQLTRHVPSRNDWDRVMSKLDDLEKKIENLKRRR